MTQPKICGVYCFTHVPTGRKYVGSSIDCWKRRKSHIALIVKRDGSSFHRQAAKLGVANFTFEIIEECEPPQRFKIESDYIEKFFSAVNGFNVQSKTDCWDRNFTDDMRSKMSARQKERFKNPQEITAASERMKLLMGTPEARAAQSVRSKFFHGAPEERLKNSDRTKLYFSSPENRAAAGARSSAYFSDPAARARQGKVVVQLTLSGDPIKEFPSLTEAGNSISRDRSAISQSLRTGGKCGGYYWKFKGDHRGFTPKASKISVGLRKPVIQISLGGAIIAVHPSVSDAAGAISRGPSKITYAIKRGGTSGGFRWEYAK